MTPLISIIIPTYNREKIVARTIDCIINQSFKDWECILVDDFSNDSTYEVLLSYARRDTRLKVFKNERVKGACGARNTGLSKAKGEYVQFFDSDDEMLPDLLYELYNHFSDNVDVVTCWTNVIDINTKKRIRSFENITEGNIHDDLMSGKTYVDTNCALIRKKVVDSIGGWSEDCPSYQEWDFHLRLSKKARYKTLNKYLINYFVGGSDTISLSSERDFQGMLYILNKYRRAWITKFPLIYIKKVYGLRCQLQMFNGSVKFEKMYSSYKQKICFISRLIVSALYFMKNK